MRVRADVNVHVWLLNAGLRDAARLHQQRLRVKAMGTLYKGRGRRTKQIQHRNQRWLGNAETSEIERAENNTAS